MRLSCRFVALVMLASTLAACASSDGGDGDGPRAGASRGPRRPLPNVFISPAGEPFRAEPGAPYPVAVWFMQADSDHDGRLSRAEFDKDALKFFDRLDANHDGVIDGLELQSYEQNVAPEILPKIEDLHAYEGMDMNLTFDDPNNTENRSDRRRASPGRGGDRAPIARGVGMQGAAVYSLLNMPEPVAAADSHFDGRITRAEFAAAADHRFDLLDKAKRGYLTLENLPRTPLQSAILKARKDKEKDRSRTD